MVDERIPRLSHYEVRSTAVLSGREPVLQGAYSQILSDRRGAYRVGSLPTLLHMMDGPQQLLFRRWIVRVALRNFRPFDESLLQDERVNLVLEALRLWYQAPTLPTLEAVREAENLAQNMVDTSVAALHEVVHASRHTETGAITRLFTTATTLSNMTRMVTLEVHLASMLFVDVLPVNMLLSNADVRHWTSNQTQIVSGRVTKAVRRAQLRVAYIILGGGSP